MKKIISFIMVLVMCFCTISVCVSATDNASVSEVVEMLEGIDTLQQMQNKRYSYTASSHYDINTTNTSIITKHEKARNGYESYVADMFAKRDAAQKAYDALIDEEKSQINSVLVEKLNNELPTFFDVKEIAVTPRNDEYSFLAVDGGLGYAYEVGNYMVSGEIPQTFILVDTTDGATTWTPNGKYVCGESNYEVTYCCDVKTPIDYGTYYKRVNLEDSSYFDAEESKQIRAILEKSYPYLTMEEMKDTLKADGMDAEFVDSLNRADLISAAQMAVWSFANINDEAADGLEYFATINVPKNNGIYFTPLHDYTNELWQWLPGKRQRTFNADDQYRVNTLAEYLLSLPAVEAKKDQIVISELEVVKTELVDEENGLYHITMYVALNGGGNEKDDLKLHTTSYSENKDGSITVTEKTDCKAELNDGVYSITTHAKDGDKIAVRVDGNQMISKGVYFYDPEGGRDSSQSLVGISEGLTPVSVTKNTLFIAELANIPVQDIETPEPELEIKPGETIQIAVTVKPENASNKEVTYTSSDESVVTVDEKGNITPVGEGTAIITVISADKPSVKKEITITVLPEKPEVVTKHYIVFGKTEKIGWYSVSLDGGVTFNPVFGNSNLEVAEGTEMIILANDVFGDPFTFYVNGQAVTPDENGYIRVVVEGPMLIGALGIPVIAPDAEESLNWIQKIWNAIVNFFKKLFNL